MKRRRDANADESSAFYQERRKEIVDQAALAFLERGFQATSIGIIAEKLNTDRASIYYYFGSKQELFREVVREVGLKAVEAAEAIAKSEGPADQKLRQAFQAVMETYDVSYPYMNVFLQENFSVVHEAQDEWSAEARDWGRRYYVAIRQIIQQGVDDQVFHLTLPVGVTTMAVLGTVNWTHRWYKPGGILGPQVLGEGFANMLLNGLTSPANIPKPPKQKRKSEKDRAL
ncbi:TetR/AcrR family transcriptional regulator [Polaromonas hydrogenivorans]|uniref:TetR/AcrR family transcriptional regulator n=1 Tax=Polaromonas hydrogenivorans TaxID=335476 RepID=A0AAU7M0A3_9BURK